MDKIVFGILLSVAVVSVGLSVGFSLFVPEFEKGLYKPDEAIIINNVKFEGTSGYENNSIVLFFEKENIETNVVVKKVYVYWEGLNRTFSIKPEENNYVTKIHGQITLIDVGWIKNTDYNFYVFASNGVLCGSINKTA